MGSERQSIDEIAINDESRQSSMTGKRREEDLGASPDQNLLEKTRSELCKPSIMESTSRPVII
jgi:hypothetical protein